MELSHRMHQAWHAFHKHRKVLMNHHVSLYARLKYFDACVSPTILFALCTLPLTRRKLLALDVIQRRMLRRIVGWRRNEGEPWRDTMIRMNERLARADRLYHCELWSMAYARNQWRYAEHILYGIRSSSTRTICKYTYNMISDAHVQHQPHRDRGRPNMKWDDRLHEFCKSRWPDEANKHWYDVLREKPTHHYEEEFVHFSCRHACV